MESPGKLDDFCEKVMEKLAEYRKPRNKLERELFMAVCKAVVLTLELDKRIDRMGVDALYLIARTLKEMQES